MELKTDILELKGIGQKTVTPYHKLGIYSFEDLLYYYPRDYVKYEHIQPLSDALIDQVCFFKARVMKQPLMRRAGKLQVVTAQLLAEGVFVSAVWFHMPYLTKSLKAGKEFVLRGVLQRQGSRFHVEQPSIFTEEQYQTLLDTLQPVYPLTKGLSNQALCKSVKQVLAQADIPQEDMMSDSVLKDEPIVSRKEALFHIHFPKDGEELLQARRRLVFDEFFIFLLKLRMLKEDNARAKNNFAIFPAAETIRLVEALPYKLTGAQRRVWEEVEADLQNSQSMSRQLQGDVGSGKTIIAVLAAIMTGCSRYQTAFMVPTEILAMQHFETISKLLKQYQIPLKAAVLTGSMTAAKKREVYSLIETNEVQIIIGTHALIQEKVRYSSLALVITDEQHRFGVRQREALAQKSVADVPHVLVMSATPIPRTLAIIMYGDLDISVIDEVPARRLPIKNCVVNTDYRKTAYKFIENEVENGRQAYIICPLVEASEGLDAADVCSYTEKIRSIFPERIRIACLHGKMKPVDKNAVMEAFFRNEIHILVSTTVVEVGVNVPNASVMLIENAERFGLSQLHQLRGRIGRGDLQSYCIFMSANRSKQTMQRLETLNRSNDGFFIASEDLKLRGPGDLFGIRQSGEVQFRLGDIFTDADLLKRAADSAWKLLKEDPHLEKEEHLQMKTFLDAQVGLADLTGL
ncbi:MAG: ATP-dependent DNA helicase RecG [Lachnospiraceae bacterium]